MSDENIRKKCPNKVYEMSLTPIINILLFIGDCREHSYLMSFLFDSYFSVINDNINRELNISLETDQKEKLQTLRNRYKLQISYNTFYIPDNKDPIQYKDYDHVINVLIEISETSVKRIFLMHYI